MRRLKPSLFAIVSLLVLLALGVAANLHIAHQEPAISLARGIDYPITNTSSVMGTPPSDVEQWPTIPGEIQESFGPPSNWEHYNDTLHRWYLIEWYQFEEDPTWWARLLELRSGFPWTARSLMAAQSGDDLTIGLIWPLTDGQYLAPQTTYHPLGLILNPIVYALPPWCALLLLRHTLIRLKQRRRTAKGQCPHCAYDLSATQHLPTCPECGHANQSQPQPISA